LRTCKDRDDGVLVLILKTTDAAENAVHIEESEPAPGRRRVLWSWTVDAVAATLRSDTATPGQRMRARRTCSSSGGVCGRTGCGACPWCCAVPAIVSDLAGVRELGFRRATALWSASGYVEGDGGTQTVSVSPTAIRIR